MKILAIESSCDETAAAVVEDGRKVLSSAVNSQVEEHRKYGGVVPEIASRRHTENIVGIVDEALREAGCNLEDVDAVAVTAHPASSGRCWWVSTTPRALPWRRGSPSSRCTTSGDTSPPTIWPTRT